MAVNDVDLISYLMRVLLALAVMGFFALLFVRAAKSKGWARRSGAKVEVVASLPLGKDVFFVLRCGPDVIALTSGRMGISVIGRWAYDEWVRRQASEDPSDLEYPKD